MKILTTELQRLLYESKSFNKPPFYMMHKLSDLDSSMYRFIISHMKSYSIPYFPDNFLFKFSPLKSRINIISSNSLCVDIQNHKYEKSK